jgi:hypothetical protein
MNIVVYSLVLLLHVLEVKGLHLSLVIDCLTEVYVILFRSSRNMLK